MNIVQKVTLRHLQSNRRRTLVTIIGVILSVAMLSAVSTIVVSFLDLFVRTEIQSSGAWQARFLELPPDDIAAVRDSEAVEFAYAAYLEGYSPFPQKEEGYWRPYWLVCSYDAQGLEQIGPKLVEGRLPEKEGEILLSQTAVDEMTQPYQVGDTLTLTPGQRLRRNLDAEGVEHLYEATIHDAADEEEEYRPGPERRYTVTGIYEEDSINRSTSAGFLAISFLNPHALPAGERVDLSFALKSVRPSFLGGQFYSDVQSLAQAAGFAGDIQYHSELLMYSGVMMDVGFLLTIATAVGIIGFIILLGSVALIYNSFSISLAERNRYLGMLASVGATSRQKGRSVLFEAAVIGAISIPIGLLSGVVGIGVTFLFVNPLVTNLFYTDAQLRLVVSLPALLVAVFFSIVILLISAAVPAWRASRISPIDAIRQAGEVMPEKRHLRVSWVTRKLFGFEGTLALKNVKRNHKRYLATLFSLIISVVLFLAASGFSYYLNNSFRMTQMGVEYDLRLNVSSESGDDLDYILDRARRLPDGESSITVQTRYMDLDIDDSRLRDLGREKGCPLQLILLGMDQESFEAYAKKAGVPVSGEAGILINTVNFKQETTFSQLQLTNLRAGDVLTGVIPVYDQETGEQKEEVSVSFDIGGVTGQVPSMVPNYQEYQPILYLVVPLSRLENIPDRSGEYNTDLYFTASNADGLEEDLLEIARQEPGYSLYVSNVKAQIDKFRQLTIFFSIFFYGFVALISLISVANIFNTVSTSVALRTREFAMLKSVGMTPKGVSRMLSYESLFYGLKSLLYGIPLGIAAMWLIYTALGNRFQTAFSLPWGSLAAVIVAVFVVVGSTMRYASSKMKRQNIIDALKQENL